MDDQPQPTKPKWLRGVAWAILIYSLLGIGSSFVSSEDSPSLGNAKYVIWIMGGLLACASGYYLFVYKPTGKPAALSHFISLGPPQPSSSDPSTRQKPSCLTPLAAWGIGGFILFRHYIQERAVQGASPNTDDSQTQILLGVVCFIAGLAVWGLDWWKYKQGID